MDPLEPPQQEFKAVIHTLKQKSAERDVREVPIADFLAPAFKIDHIESTKLLWIHLPANDMAWVEPVMREVATNMTLDENCWTLIKMLPAASQITRKPIHSLHMEPSCTASGIDTLRHPGMNTASDIVSALSNEEGVFHNSALHQPETPSPQTPLISTYIPYMNWDTYQRVSTRHMLYKQAISSSRYQPDIEISDEVFYSGIERYLAANLYRDKLPTHPRRTLDQSYYFSLDDTSKRDADQTISKWTGHELPPDGRDSAAPDSLMIMVDQLWCWVLNDRVVVSCFPSGTSESCALDFTGLYSRMTKSWNECDSIWSLYSTLVKEATTHIFQQENKKFLDLVETYRWVVSKKAANQINHFNDFHDTHSSSRFDAEALDDRQELRSVLDVADILDELKMIQSLIYEQREVIKSFAIALTKFQPSQGSPDQDVNNVLRAERITASHDSKVYIFQVINQDNSRLGDTIKLIAQRISEPMRTMIVATDEILDSIYNQIEAVRKDAEYTHQQLLNLLDLKQKTAALAEARATTQQGRAIMLFTIVTIIFLPLSFFTSYFGQNVSDITGDDDNPTSLELWRYGAPISVAIILLALAIAGAIAWPHRFLWLRFGMRA